MIPDLSGANVAVRPVGFEEAIVREFLLLTGWVGVLVAGCGGSDRWVSIPMMGCEELEKAQEDAANFPTMMNDNLGPSTCREAGGLRYAGDFRCEDNQVQVLCEEG